LILSKKSIGNPAINGVEGASAGGTVAGPADGWEACASRGLHKLLYEDLGELLLGAVGAKDV